MRAIPVVLVALVACGGAAVPVTAPAPKEPAATTTVVAPPAEPAAPASVHGLARPAAPTPVGCVIEERRYAKLELRLRPTDPEPLFSGNVDGRTIVLGVDGTMHVVGTLLAGTLHVKGFSARSAIPLYTDAEFGGMLSTRAAVRWVGTSDSGEVSLAIHLPIGVTFDDAESVTTQVACGAVKLTASPPHPIPGTPVYVSGDLSRSPGAPPRLRGFHGTGRRIAAQGDWVRVILDERELRAIGWVRKRDASEPAMGIGHGYGTGYGAGWAWSPPKGGLGCAAPLAIYLPLPDGSFGEIGRYAAGAPLWIKETDGAWATVELGPSGLPEHDLPWRARTADLATCNAGTVKGGTWKSTQ